VRRSVVSETGGEAAASLLAEDLKRRILALQLHPGTHLKELDLADGYQVGRHTVRLALQRLVHEGLVDHVRNQGAVVRVIRQEDVRDLFVLRLGLELGAVHTICVEHLDVGEAERKAQVFAELQAKATVEGEIPVRALLEADLAWHHSIVLAAQSPRLDAAYDRVVNELRFFLSVYRIHQIPVRVGHASILALLRVQDEASASRLLTEHLFDSRNHILAAMAEP
jgi:DNA-binding GntR family transcriptional regulator